MSKAPTVRIPSDGCVIVAPGIEPYYPHVGEWVDVVLVGSVGELQAIARLRELAPALAAAQGEPDEMARTLALLDPHFEEVLGYLAGRVMAWSWTDNFSRPLPQPDGTPGPLRLLTANELYWLLFASQADDAGTRKKGSRPSPITSSATARRPNPKRSGKGRSHGQGT